MLKKAVLSKAKLKPGVMKAYMSQQVSDLSYFHFRDRNDQMKKVIENPNYDILVIGGGATGAGALVSASLKGYRTLLIDANDFAAGTSSKSTKLLHGGLRYLENAFKIRNNNRREDFHLVNEALNERDILLNNVPYLSKQVGMVIPLTNIFEAMFYYCGCLFYHTFAKMRRNGILSIFSKRYSDKYPFQVDKPKLMAKRSLRAMIPALHSKFKYGVLLFDGQSDDSSLVIDTLLTATSLDDPEMRQNEALNYARLLAFTKDKEGKISGAKILDKATGKEFTVSCKVAINATGIFGDEIKKLANPEATMRLAFAKGDHIALDNEDEKILPHNLDHIGVFIPKTADGRVMFVLPWLRSVIAGTTDKIVEKPSINPTADETSISEILSNVKNYFPASTLKVNSKWSGIRPLVKDLEIAGGVNNGLNSSAGQNPNGTDAALDKSTNQKGGGSQTEASDATILTKDLKRVHVIDVDPVTDLITVYGGKLTIFRKMGEDAINEASERLKSKGHISDKELLSSQKKTTETLKWIGDFRRSLASAESGQAEQRPTFQTRLSYMNYLQDFYKSSFPEVPADIIYHLSRRYGCRALFILREIGRSKEKGRRLDIDLPYTRAEIEHIIKNEFVVFPIDVIVRRIRLSFTEASLAKKLLPHIIDIFGELHNWDDSRRRKEYQDNLDQLEKMDF